MMQNLMQNPVNNGQMPYSGIDNFQQNNNPQILPPNNNQQINNDANKLLDEFKNQPPPNNPNQNIRNPNPNVNNTNEEEEEEEEKVSEDKNKKKKSESESEHIEVVARLNMPDFVKCKNNINNNIGVMNDKNLQRNRHVRDITTINNKSYAGYLFLGLLTTATGLAMIAGHLWTNIKFLALNSVAYCALGIAVIGVLLTIYCIGKMFGKCTPSRNRDIVVYAKNKKQDTNIKKGNSAHHVKKSKPLKDAKNISNKDILKNNNEILAQKNQNNKNFNKNNRLMKDLNVHDNLFNKNKKEFIRQNDKFDNFAKYSKNDLIKQKAMN